MELLQTRVHFTVPCEQKKEAKGLVLKTPVTCHNWWNSTQSSQEDAMNIFVAAIGRVVVILLKGKSREVLQTQGFDAHGDWIPGVRRMKDEE